MLFLYIMGISWFACQICIIAEQGRFNAFLLVGGQFAICNLLVHIVHGYIIPAFYSVLESLEDGRNDWLIVVWSNISPLLFLSLVAVLQTNQKIWGILDDLET